MKLKIRRLAKRAVSGFKMPKGVEVRKQGRPRKGQEIKWNKMTIMMWRRMSDSQVAQYLHVSPVSAFLHRRQLASEGRKVKYKPQLAA